MKVGRHKLVALVLTVDIDKVSADFLQCGKGGRSAVDTTVILT